jgi:hypothetical protein
MLRTHCVIAGVQRLLSQLNGCQPGLWCIHPLDSPPMASKGQLKTPTDRDHLTCRLCHESFKAITRSHLFFRHDLRSTTPVRDYKRRFNLRSAQSLATARRRKAVQVRRATSEGRRWTRDRLRTLVLRRAAHGEPVNVQAVRREHPVAPRAALKLYGGWDTLLRSVRLDPAKVRLRQNRTRAALIREGRSMARRGVDLSPGAIHRNFPAHEDAVLSRFETWDAYLRAIGQDPARHRKRRRWNRELVRRRILAFRRIPTTREIQRRDPGFHAAVGRYLGPWKKSVTDLGREYPSES